VSKNLFRYGGFIAGIVLIAFGIGAIYMGVDGRSTVQSSLKLEKITGSDDMTPATIKAEAKEAGLPSSLALPTCDIAGKPINDGTSARCFASYIRIHALESSGGLTYSELPRFASEDGKGTSDPAAALKDAEGEPVANPVRTTWINATALSTALNVSYMAQQLALFGIVVGIALLLSGVGFIVLAAGLLGGALVRRTEDETLPVIKTTAAPVGI
jgi:hypothetical protein